MPRHLLRWLPIILLVCSLSAVRLWAQETVVPHNQDQLPNEPRTAQEALQYMEVPDGFQVQVVGAEPDIVNPVAMAFDARGRIWITESLEYPRRSAGPGRDRIKILEDTDQDGQIDSVKIFADGLNIPSGIALGYGGVWVANSPDILFLQDTDGDDVADKRQVVATGFGRDDTHELPNSLTWGPDGYLYGLNGVFNYSHVEQDGTTFDFTCAMFRIDPVSHKFEVFAQGTSNPWGIAFDNRGEAFVSACVIDHLWHLSEAGYYQRQAGAYPPHTWIMDSIVQHKHFKAAYCGVHYFDSHAFPESYRQQMYMGNIHGGSINSDAIQVHGGSYRSTGNQDLLQANDVWFMPVAQKTAPDGSMYILDWYDRYHCYQDANRDPAGIDRLKGRLYRVCFGEPSYDNGADLSRATDDQLIERLNDDNVHFRDQAQHLLAYRLIKQQTNGTTKARLLQLATSSDQPRWRRRAMWTLSSSRQISLADWRSLVSSQDPVVRAFAIRTAGNLATARDPEIAERWKTTFRQPLQDLAPDPDPQVRLALMVAARKILGADAVSLILRAGHVKTESEHGASPVFAQLTWQNLLPLLQKNPELATMVARSPALLQHPDAVPLARRLTSLLLEQGNLSIAMEMLVDHGTQADDRSMVEPILNSIRQRVISGELGTDPLKTALPTLRQLPTSPMQTSLLALAGDDEAVKTLTHTFQQGTDDTLRSDAFSVLCFLANQDRADAILNAAETVLQSDTLSPPLAQSIVDSLLQVRSPRVARQLLQAYQHLDPPTRSRVVESLTSRPDWAAQLFQALGDGTDQIPTRAVNYSQVQRLWDSGDESLKNLIQKNWGSLNLDAAGVQVDEMLRVRRIVRQLPGDHQRGWEVYDRVCGQCHEFAGRGHAVGPALDANGRASLTQLLSNMVSPNLVIGKDYQARLVMTTDGRLLSGLVMEDSPQRLVLNIQGGKQVTVPRDEIEEMKVSELSLMPENQTQQMSDQELADLLALLVKVNPTDPQSDRIPETQVAERTQWDTTRYAELLAESFAGFATDQHFEGGLGLLESYRGRPAVVRTHPVSRKQPTLLSRKVTLPADVPMNLTMGVSHHDQGDWVLRITVNGKSIDEQVVRAETCKDGWLDHDVDLSQFAGQTIDLTLEHHANDWAYEYGFWSHAYLMPRDSSSVRAQ